MRKVLSLAVYPSRHITANPIPREWMPRTPKSANKAKSCLFPHEDAKLASCAAVPLERRLAYGVLAREGCEPASCSSFASVTWTSSVGASGSTRTRRTTRAPGRSLSPDVVRVLAWWKKRQEAEDDDLVRNIDLTQGPRWLRGKTWDPKTRHKNELGDLRTAGVARPELFERSASRMPVRLHDLRATFVTVSLANGKTEQWVSDRTGHKSSQMISLYARQARTWAELSLGALRPLDELLVEMRVAADTPTSPERPLATDGPESSSPFVTAARTRFLRVDGEPQQRKPENLGSPSLSP